MTQTTRYDFVIIGAGSAGCVLAERLSADPSARVLLLEAGGVDRGMHVRIPAAFPKLFHTAKDWAHSTTPEREMGGRELFWPRAKMLGGCSSMNAQCYVRGNAADFDLWEDLGNPGWGFRDVLPYFTRAERGPLRVEGLRDANPTSTAFLEAAAECGIRRIEDVNGPTQEGAAPMRVTQKGGRRWSAADGYLRPAMRRANLTVQTGAHVTRVVLEGRRATGVEYLRDGASCKVSCGEVILSAGSITSPHLLLLSGIGPASELEAHGVEVAHDLPGVGQNLQDHLAAPVIWACRERVSLLSALSPANLLRYLVLGRGPLTSNVAEACAFVKTRPELGAPDLELLFAPVPFIGHGLIPQTEHALTIGVVLQQPKSRGAIRLASRDPRDRPRIEASYLSDAGGEDLATMVRGVELARRLFRAPALARHVTEERYPVPGASPEDHVRAHGQTLYHPVGTCRMGRDANAVVDPELRVRGLDGLRVIDASIMPVIIRGHTHGPTVMIGERGADLVLGRAKPIAKTAAREAEARA